MKLIEKIFRYFRLAAVLSAVALTSALVSCDSVIYEKEGDCNYYVHFKYDYNMKWADAFSHEVSLVTLYVIDPQSGRIIWRKTESGKKLSASGYAMSVDVEPGRYDLIAWCGVENPKSFKIADAEQKTGLTATLDRETDTDDGSAHVRGEVDRLYYGHLDNQTFGHDNYHFTVPLIKNTNTIRIVLQHLSGEPVPESMFTYTITDDNGLLDWNNDVLEDRTLTYHAWHTDSGTAELEPPADISSTRTAYSTAVAEFTVSRLMKDHAPAARLIVRRADNGEKVINIKLIDALLLVKGHYNRVMSDQEYLDRQDEYSLTFFLDEGFRWLNACIHINSWYVVLQETEL